MKQQLLLLEDVEALGQKGDVVSARPGYVRNYLLPQQLAVIASPNTLRKRERLRQERENKRSSIAKKQMSSQNKSSRLSSKRKSKWIQKDTCTAPFLLSM